MKRTLVTITEFARMIEVSRDTIYKWIQADKLPEGTAVKKVAGRNFISVREDEYQKRISTFSPANRKV